MRWLILSDIHGDRAALEAVLGEAGPVDLAVLAGDLTDFGDAVEARSILAPLHGRGLPLVSVSGNCDRDGVRLLLESSGISVEGRSRELLGFRFAGAGGGLHRHGMTPYEPGEEELEAILLAALESADAGAGGRAPAERLVVVTHSPPNGTAIDRRGARHVGSHSLRSLLGSRAPLLWISGHIHEARGLDRVGASILLNPGSVHEGRYALAELDEEMEPLIELRSLDQASRGR